MDAKKLSSPDRPPLTSAEKRSAIEEVRAIVAPYLPKGRDQVQEFLDERRAEAKHESE